jgi:hypothetical protein
MFATAGYVSVATSSFTVPTTALYGATRMRIMMDYNTGIPANPCAPSVSGRYEVEDYTFIVGSVPSSYVWSNGSSTVGTTNPLSQSPTANTSYTCSATFNGCPVVSNIVAVVVTALPSSPTGTSSVQCGTQIPTASVSGNNSQSSPLFNWYSASTGGTLLAESGYTGTLTTYYNNDFSSSLTANGVTATVAGTPAAAIAGGAMQITALATGQVGGFTVPATGIDVDAHEFSFKLLTTTGGADGFSFNFGNDVATSSSSAESGSGTKLSVTYSIYTTPGIAIKYNGVQLGFYNTNTWIGTNAQMLISINNQGQIAVSVDGTAVLSNVQLPAAYLTENKSTWNFGFLARSGGISGQHVIDDVIIKYASYISHTTYPISISTTTPFYVSEVVNGCISPRTLVNVTVNTPDAITAAASVSPITCLSTPTNLSVSQIGSTNTYALTWLLTSYLGSGLIAATSATLDTPLPVTPSVGGATYTYTITGVDATLGCTTVSSVSVVVNLPVAAVATAATSLSGTSFAANWNTVATATGYFLDVSTVSNFSTFLSGYNNLNVGNVLTYAVSIPATGVYYYRVRPATPCGGSNSNAITVSAVYCAPSSTSTLYYIRNVVSTTGQTNISNNTNAISGGGYGNFAAQSCSNFQSYNMTVATTLYYGYGTIYAWVDWNDDLDFSDVGEAVLNSGLITTYTYPHTYTGTFQIPSTAVIGNHIMRIRYDYSSGNNPCGAITYGEAEDYTLTVLAPPIPTISSFNSSSTCPGSTVNIVGSGFLGVTSVKFGGVDAVSYTVNSFTSITAVAPNSSGAISVTNSNGTGTSAASISIDPTAPATPTVTATGSTIINVGGAPTLNAVGSGGDISWYTTSSGGTPVSGGISLPAGTAFSPVQCTPNTTSNPTYTLYAEEAGTTCNSARAPISFTVKPILTSDPANGLLCTTGATATLGAQLSNVSGGATGYQWSSSTDGTTFNSIVGATSASYTTLVSVTATTIYKVTATVGTCGSVSAQQTIGVLAPLNFTPTAQPASLCQGETSVIAHNLQAGNFSAVCIASAGLSTPASGVTPTVLYNNGVLQTMPAGVVASASTDDGFFSGIPIGFNYNYFGDIATNVFVGTNGTIVLNVPGAVGSSTYIFSGFPNAASPAATVAVSARDLNFGYLGVLAGTLRYWTEGIAPTRKFVVQYIAVPVHVNEGGTQNAEAIFYETTGIVDINVASATNGTSVTAARINKYIGLQNAAKTIGATATNCATSALNYWNGVSAQITAAQGWRFTPGATYNTVWSEGSSAIVGAPATSHTSTNIPNSYTTAALNTAGLFNYSIAATSSITGCTSTAIVPITVNQIPGAPNTSNSTQCGPLVPTASVSSGNGQASPTFNWYNATPITSSGLINQLQTHYTNNFAIASLVSTVGTVTGTVAGTPSASVLGGVMQLTANLGNQDGGFTVPSIGVNASTYQFNFKLTTTAGGADGFSFNFADAPATSSASAESGSGNKLSVTFDIFGIAGTAGGAGIRVLYAGTELVYYSASTAWIGGTNVPMIIDINTLGKLTLKVNGTSVISNLQLPAAFLSSDKSAWKFAYLARTGGTAGLHTIDDVSILSVPIQNTFANSVGTSGSTAQELVTMYVSEIVNGCESATGSTITVTVNPLPALPTTAPVTYCQGAPSAALTATGGTAYNWFTDLLTTTSPTSAPTPATSTVGAVTYYATNVGSNGCQSTPRTPLIVTVNALPAAPASLTAAGTPAYVVTPVDLCQSATPAQLTAAAAAGNSLQWYTDPATNAGQTATIPSPSTAAVTTFNYFVSQKDNTTLCESSRTPVVVNINPIITASVINSASSTSACGGGAITFTATPTNGGTPTYQWSLNGSPVGSNSATYTASLQSNDQIMVAMTPSAQACLTSVASTNSNTITLTSTAATPTVAIQSTAVSAICPGTAVTFSLQSSNNMGTPGGYQWQESIDNGVTWTDIALATSATYNSSSLANSHMIRLVMTSGITGAGCLTSPTATSNEITTTLNAATAITAAPTDQSACLSGTANFNVVATGTGILSYQWKKNGTDITGNTSAISNTLSLGGIAVGDAPGNYTVFVTGTCGSANTSVTPVTLTINAATTSTSPLSIVKCPGEVATFSVTAGGAGTLAYQWKKNGTDITGNASALTSSLSFTSVIALDAGTYTVAVTGTCGTFTTANTGNTLLVNAPTTISVQPSGFSQCAGTIVNLAVTAGGAGTLTYQWKQGATNVGTNNSLYTINPISASSGGYYTVDVTGTCGTITSNTATVTVNPVTTITSQPTALPSCEGSTVNLTVGVTATSPITYQWKYGSTNITGNASALTNSLALTNIQESISGNYSVVVSGGCGSATSQAAPVIINTAPYPYVVSATSAAMCENVVNTLNASTTADITFKVGTATGTSTAGNTPYRQNVNVPNQYKVQYVLLASELTALGLSGSTSLRSLGFNVTTANTGAMSKYYIGMANTTTSAIGAAFIDTSALIMTNVYSTTNYQPVTGLNSHTFTTPFVWDGISNVLVQISHYGANTVESVVETITTPFVASASRNGAGAWANVAYNNSSADRPVLYFSAVQNCPITWTTNVAGLYTNTLATTPYVNSVTGTVYAYPGALGSYTYTATATSLNGCLTISPKTITVQNANNTTVASTVGSPLLAGDYLWNGNTSTIWQTASNWFKYDGSNFLYSTTVPLLTDRVFVLVNANSGSNCLSTVNPATVNVTVGNGEAKDVFIGVGATMLMDAGKNLIVNGDWTNNGTFTPNATASVTFNGTGAQAIGGSNSTTFTNLTVNKSSGLLTLNKATNASENLTMTAGDISTTSTNLLTVGTSPTAVGSLAWSGGSVLGPIKRWFSGTPSATQPSGIFPVGLAGVNRYAQVNYASGLTTGGAITAEYIAGVCPILYAGLPNDVNGQMIQNYENEGYWSITPGTGAEAGDLNTAQYSLKLRGNTLSAVTSVAAMSQLRMIKSISHASWDNVGIGTNTGATGGVSDFTITNNAMTGFSWFNIGSGQINWLPIELTNFAANCNEKSQVDIKWSTASEQNSENFIIERSRDLTQWEYVSTVNAAGNSNYNIDYSTVDTDPLSRISYYRLVQVDNNGVETIYGPISVSCGGNENGMVVFPNPTQGKFTVEISSTEIFTNAQLQITDLTGKVIYERSANILEGKNQFTFEGLNLQLGTYIINLNSVNGKINPVRVVVN